MKILQILKYFIYDLKIIYGFISNIFYETLMINVLEFNLDDKIKSDIVKTLNEYKRKYESLDTNYFEFFNVGRKSCKKYGISADSLMQLCFQVNFKYFQI